MPSIDTEYFEDMIFAYFRVFPLEGKKFDNEANVKRIFDRMCGYGLTTPSFTMVRRSIQELVAEGKIARVDGGNAQTDAVAAATAKQAKIERQASAPLTARDWEEFAGMSKADVARRFHADPIFQARYRKAAELWQFELPEKPAPQAETNNFGQYNTLTVRQYWAMPTADIVRLYRSDRDFKRRVDRWIADGLI